MRGPVTVVARGSLEFEALIPQWHAVWGDLADRIIGADPELSAPEHAAARAAVERWERNASVREDAG